MIRPHQTTAFAEYAPPTTPQQPTTERSLQREATTGPTVIMAERNIQLGLIPTMRVSVGYALEISSPSRLDPRAKRTAIPIQAGDGKERAHLELPRERADP